MRKIALLAAVSVFSFPALAQEQGEPSAPFEAPMETQAETPAESSVEAPVVAPIAEKPKAPVLVTAGEHGDFSRVVVAGAGAKVTQSGRSVRIALDSAADADLSVLSGGRRATRVSGARLIPGGAGNDIVLDLGCDCRITTTRLPNGKFVVDIFDTAGAVKKPTETAARAPVKAAAAETPAPVIQTTKPTAAQEASSETLQPVFGDNVVAAGADKMSVEQARKRMVALLQQAANDGIITVKPGAEDLTAPKPPESQNQKANAKPVELTNASIPGKAPSPAGSRTASPPTPTETDEDAEATPTLKPAEAPVSVARSQSACLPDGALAIDGRKFADSPLEAIAALQGELEQAQVDAKPAIAERLALGYLAIGFGEEALISLSGIGAGTSLYADMARVVAEKRPAPDGLLMRGAECRGAHAMWLAAVEEPKEAAKSAARAGDAINALPVRLRGALAARIARSLVGASDGEAARRYLQIALKASGKTPELKFVEAKLMELQGRGDQANAILDELEHENGRAAKDALNELAHDASRDGLGEDLGVLAKNARGTADEGRAALREASFWADSGAIESGVFLLRDAARRDATIAPEAVRKARETLAAAFASGDAKKRIGALAAYIHDRDFLQTEGGDPEIAKLASDAAIEFGVPNAAHTILKASAAAEGLGPARVARAALAAGAAEDAVAAAAPFADQADFASVLVKANIELGRGYAALAAASALPESPEKAALIAEAAWRARDYKSAARAFAKIDPASLTAQSAERFGYAAYMAGELTLPSAAEAVLRDEKSPTLARLQTLFKPAKDGPFVERGKSVVSATSDDIKLIEEMLGG